MATMAWETNMSRGLPSMTALLGLLAIAGYQNRDKLAEMLNGAGANKANPGGGGPDFRWGACWVTLAECWAVPVSAAC